MRQLAVNHRIGQHHSAGAANAVADQRVGVAEPDLVRVTGIMQENLETPLDLEALAARCRLSKRRLERLFSRHLGEPPHRYYLRMRLERARHLLRYGELPIYEVAVACGFGSAAYFTRAYRARFGHPPRAERERC